jgi:hypothetical protein
MRILLICLLIAYTCSVINTNYYIYNLTFNNYYEISNTTSPSNKVPIADHYFRISVENQDLEETNLQVKFLKSDKINFKTNICGFYQYPTNSEILDGTTYIELEQRSVSSDDNFIVYIFKVPTFKKQEKIKYLVVNILNNEALDLLLVSIYSSKPEKGDPKEHTIYNFTYMKEEILNKTTLSQHKGFFVFILENKEPEKNKLITIKLNKEYSPEIRLEVAGYKERPITEEQIKNAICYDFLSLKLQTRDEDYTIYEFPIENQEINKQKYIAIATKIKEAFDFISFYIGPEL